MTAMMMSTDLFYRLECQARQSRMNFYMRFKEPKLYRYAKALEFDKITERCLRNPRAARREAKFRHEYATQQNTLHRVLEPLFLLSDPKKHDGDDSVVDWDHLVKMRHQAAKAILQLHPEAALVPCIFGTTPLSMVCLDPHGSLLDVDALVEACPRCVLLADHQGMLPLHYACLTNRAHAALIARLLQHAGIEAAAMPDHMGRLPIHYAMGAPVCFPHEAVGTMIAQQVANGEQPCDAVLQLLLEAYPEGASVRDRDGLTPLHYLCRCLLQQQQQQQQQQLGADNGKNSAATNDHISLNLLRACQQLVKADSSLLSVSDVRQQQLLDGKTPMALLLACCQRLEEDAAKEDLQDRLQYYEERIRILKECMIDT